MNFYKILVCAFISVLSYAESARILGVFPLASLSHQVVFQAYAKELANRGHELVVLTPSPQNANLHPNIKEIGISVDKALMMKLRREEIINFKRGIVVDVSPEGLTKLYSYIVNVIENQLNEPEVKQLVENKEEKFDLVVVEGFLEVHYVFSHIFDAPMISLSSFYGFPELYDAVGAAPRHPEYYPQLHRTKFRDLSFWERLQATYMEYKMITGMKKVEDAQNEMLKRYIGKNAPTVSQLKDRIDLVFLNSIPMLANNRPVPPNVIFLGGLHLQPIKPLPQDLQEYLDNSKQGVIYVSFGSNVQSAQMDDDLLIAFLGAFEKLPYNILWKFDEENIKNLPKNVKIQKWFPQRDLLTHPNIKAFVTQGGIQSFDEALDAGVPLIGMPVMNDQWWNVHKFVELGVGVEVDALTLDSEVLYNAIRRVAEDESYRKNIIKLRTVQYDQPLSSMERAMFWTEHVLRHGGGHLRASTANVSRSEYWMIDILAAAVLGSLLIAIFIYVLGKYLVALILV